MTTNDRQAEVPPEVAGFLADSLGIAVGEARILRGGARHRVLTVGAPERRVVIKLHGPPREGLEDGFERELRLHRFISRQCPGRVPALLAHDAGLRCLVLEWIDGEPLRDQLDGGEAELAAMADFLVELNRPAVRDQARVEDLPMAADGGLRLADHLARARWRIDRLLQLDPAGFPVRAEMLDWLRGDLMHDWERQAIAIAACDDPSVSPVLSPSDFGRHNTLRVRDGSLRFMDFEHAGWDDPAKLAADFILQPDHPLDDQGAGWFLACLAGGSAFPADLAARTARLLAVQRIKWVTIVLNGFIPGAVADDVPEEALCRTLEKARHVHCRPLPDPCRHEPCHGTAGNPLEEHHDR